MCAQQLSAGQQTCHVAVLLQVSSLYSDETNKFTFKRPITVSSRAGALTCALDSTVVCCCNIIQPAAAAAGVWSAQGQFSPALHGLHCRRCAVELSMPGLLRCR